MDQKKKKKVSVKAYLLTMFLRDMLAMEFFILLLCLTILFCKYVIVVPIGFDNRAMLFLEKIKSSIVFL